MHAFDLNKTRQAFRANRAKTQVFLIDACREVTTSTVEVPDPAAPALREPEQRQVEHCEHDLTIQATARTKKAYGPECRLSYFTEALLRAFAGGAAGRQGGTWWVRSDLIASRIGDLIKHAGGTEQRPVPTIQAPVVLYQLDCAPEVSLEFGCDPAEATRLAELACSRLMDGPRQQRPYRGAVPWRLNVRQALPAGGGVSGSRFPGRTHSGAGRGPAKRRNADRVMSVYLDVQIAESRPLETGRVPVLISVLNSELETVVGPISCIPSEGVSVIVDPGTYVVHLDTPSGQRLSRAVTAREGQNQSVSFDLYALSGHEALEKTALLQPFDRQDQSPGLDADQYGSVWVRLWKRETTGQWLLLVSPRSPPNTTVMEFATISP